MSVEMRLEKVTNLLLKCLWNGWETQQKTFEFVVRQDFLQNEFTWELIDLKRYVDWYLHSQ